MKIALSLCLPLSEAPTAGFGLALLDRVAARVPVTAFVRGPESVDPATLSRRDVRPLAELPALLDEGSVDVPVHVLADDLHHAHQVRFALERPGVLVLLDEELEGLARALGLEAGLRARIEERQAVTLRARTSEDPDALASRLVEAAERVAAAGLPPASPPDPGPSVEIVILTYNARGIVEDSIASALAQDYRPLRVTVVDNASDDGTADAVRERFPEVEVVRSPRNLGFAGGNNLAIERSDADYVVLLNQDAVARRDWITELVRAARTAPDVAAVGSKMLLRRCPTIFNSTGIAMNPLGFCYDRGIGEKDTDPSPTPEEVLGASGGAVLLRREALAEIGALEPSFFMYFEDLDLCWRMWLAGWRVLYAPLAVVIHDWHGDLDGGDEVRTEVEGREKTRRRRTLCERNRLQCLLRNYETRTLRRILPRAWKYDRVRLGWVKDALRRGENPDYFRMVAASIRGAWKWNLRRLPALLAQRRRIQRLRRRSDEELWRLFGDWEGEPSFLGDLYAICDRHSARGAAAVRMGFEDAGCLGPGFHAPEPLGVGDAKVRWTRGRAWLYLRPDRPSRRVVVRAGAGPKPVEGEVTVELLGGGRFRFEAGERGEFSFLLDEDVPAGRLLEVRIEATTFRPSREGIAPDDRDLGLRVEEVRIEPA